ncbi:hypothetical protein M413DRAFT_448538 [Hebeloma cylindrosporum]|uniref:F-box domain-containing protein n=1 Tax=Hebeloma cylindrosporum TaxID=76867 RepID=A0A0C2Y8Y5_HEBCY|nr:hypothetical protein M413DRAFT_448538 [Hebeloma cylindrosporum h7]
MRDTPQELIDHIVDFAHDDHTTLSAVRLVAQSWNISARAHMFRRLNLRIAPPYCSPTPLAIQPIQKPGKNALDSTTNVHYLFELIKSSPDIPLSVRDVTIGNTTQLPLGTRDELELLLCLILTQLNRVTTLRITEVNWPDLTPVFAASLMRICRSPDLRHLDIFNCTMPSMDSLVDFLNFSCSTLTSLRLSYIRIPRNTEAVVSAPSLAGIDKLLCKPRKPLQRLTIEQVPLAPLIYTLLQSTPCSFNIKQLVALSLEDISDVPSVCGLLQVAGGALEHLEMRAAKLQSKQVSLTGTIDLTRTPQLKCLRLYGLLWTGGLCPAEGLQHLFTPVQTPHPLEAIEIVVTANSTSKKALEYNSWNILDQILSKPVFASLNKLEITVHTTRISADSTPVDAKRLRDEFPALAASRSIFLNVIPSSPFPGSLSR